MIENHGDEETICFPRLGGRQSPLSSRGSDVQGRHPTLPRRRVVAPLGSSWPRRYLGGQRRHVSSCQLGAGGNTYRAGTDPYQEGGILPLLASLFSSQRGMGKQTGGFLGPIIEPIGDLIKMGFQKKAAQRGRGAGRQKGGFWGITELVKKAAQRGRGASGSKKKRKRSKYITGSSVLDPQTTLNRMFRRAGQRPIGVLPDVISGPQVGMGRRRRRPRRSHCFQGLP